ncbi:MAG TPA: H-X9-DG-CTERM domain-containing protein [Planctomycetota bacterium]|nr:H-X9-DG-CTERM domain-containing protein [Planctomycetota bacterium]
MRNLYRGTRVYLSEFDEFLPSAWHVGSASLANDLSNLTYYRCSVTERFINFYGRILPKDLVRCNGDPRAAQREKFREIHGEWTDPVEGGWTRDYFAPDIVFRMPQPPTLPLDRHANYVDLTERVGVSASDRPLLADVNASLPNPEARDPDDPEHEAEMRKGFSVVQAAGMDVFVGVGQSLRRAGDYSTSRFDFRHSKGVNILFLDGHVECVKADEKARLEKIHRYWNSIEPSADPGSAPR